jgi:hypothetical protein
MKFLKNFLLLWIIFALLDPDQDSEYGSGSTDQIKSGSATLLTGGIFNGTDSLPNAKTIAKSSEFIVLDDFRTRNTTGFRNRMLHGQV